MRLFSAYILLNTHDRVDLKLLLSLSCAWLICCCYPVVEARSLVANDGGNTTHVEVGLRVPGERHKPQRSTSVSEVVNPQWDDASFDL